MSDDLDDLLRAAMKSLDDQVPAGYFEGLPSQTLARLEDVSMQAPGTTGTDRDASTGVPPMNNRDEDSGLHDIRSLASSAKARLSSRRSTVNPVMTEDDIIASSSAGWKAVALPEPAKMVSLPALAELPSAKEVKDKDKAAKKAREAKAREEVALPPLAEAPIATPSVHATESAASARTSMPAVTPIGARLAGAKPSANRNKLIAVVGIGLAAAAGVTLFVMNSSKDQAPKAAPEAKAIATNQGEAERPRAVVTPLPPPPPAAAPAAALDEGAAGTAAAPAIEAPAPKATNTETKTDAKAAGKGVHKVEIRDTSMTDKAEKDKAAPPKDDKILEKLSSIAVYSCFRLRSSDIVVL